MMTNVDPDRSVNCYFCSALVDERDCIVADDYNDNDGGAICGTCSLEGEKNMQKKDFTVTGFLSNFEAGVTFTFRGTDSEFSKWFDGENLRELEEVEISTETLT